MDFDYNNALISKSKQFPRIDAIFGPEFVRQIIFSVSPKKHILYWWLRVGVDKKNDASLDYLNHCLDLAVPLLESLPHKKNDIVNQLKDADKFYEAFTEIEWIAKLATKDLHIAIAPFYPKKGPDLKITADGSDVYAEITSLNLSRSERKNENIWLELETRINRIVSHRHVSIITKGDFSPEDVSPLVVAIRKKISKLENKDDHNPTSLYYFSKNDIQEWYGFDGHNYPADIQLNVQNYPLYLKEMSAKARVNIYYQYRDMINTSVGTGGSAFSDIHVRIKEAVLKKIRQLKVTPVNAPKIVILDLYRTHADAITVGWGLQGQDAYQWLVDKRTGETVASGNVRLNNGAFSITKTVSAVVIPRRIESESGTCLVGDVVLNPNAAIPIRHEILKSILE